MNGVKNALRKLKNGKASGVDGITGEMLKFGDTVLDEWLCILLNACLREAIVPNDWKSAVIIPLYKGKGSKDCQNYQGISQLQSVRKSVV